MKKKDETKNKIDKIDYKTVNSCWMISVNLLSGTFTYNEKAIFIYIQPSSNTE